MLGLISHNIIFFLLEVFKQIKIYLHLGKKIIGRSSFCPLRTQSMQP